MFKRKEDDIDLLSDTGGSVTDSNSNTEPKMTNPTGMAPMASPSSASPMAAPAAMPETPASSGMGYTRPADTGDASRLARPGAFRPGGDMGRPAAGRPGTDYRPASAAPTSAPSAAPAEKGKASGRRVLTVGHDILLKGEIATCDRLVIEGAVDATLNEVHTVEIAETGSFKGAADIEDAEISGVFDGELTVRNRLVIYSTGQVRGKITYGEVEIERGGELTGTIKSFKSGDAETNKNKNEGKKEKAAA